MKLLYHLFRKIMLTYILTQKRPMIKDADFALIDTEIKDCLQNTLDEIKNNSLHNYIVFLAMVNINLNIKKVF